MTKRKLNNLYLAGDWARTLLAYKLFGLVHIREALVACRWNAMTQHEVLGPLFVRLNLRALLAGAKAGNARLLQHIAQPQSQRIFGSNHHQRDQFLRAPLGNGLEKIPNQHNLKCKQVSENVSD